MVCLPHSHHAGIFGKYVQTDTGLFRQTSGEHLQPVVWTIVSSYCTAKVSEEVSSVRASLLHSEQRSHGQIHERLDRVEVCKNLSFVASCCVPSKLSATVDMIVSTILFRSALPTWLSPQKCGIRSCRLGRVAVDPLDTPRLALLRSLYNTG